MLEVLVFSAMAISVGLCADYMRHIREVLKEIRDELRKISME